jgi:dihydrofolate reductase
MGRIAVHEFISLDGVFEDPRWTFEFGFDPRMGDALAAITGTAKAILLGRTTYEMFAPAWSTRTVEDDPGAPFFNDTHKYVVGGRQPDVDWGPSTLLGPFDADAIRKVKDETDGIVYVSGSGTLVRGLLAEGLVDELHLFVYPVVLGKGKQLWSGDAGPTGPLKLSLTEHQAYDNGVVHLAYGAAADRDATVS